MKTAGVCICGVELRNCASDQKQNFWGPLLWLMKCAKLETFEAFLGGGGEATVLCLAVPCSWLQLTHHGWKPEEVKEMNTDCLGAATNENLSRTRRPRGSGILWWIQGPRPRVTPRLQSRGLVRPLCTDPGSTRSSRNRELC